MPKGPIGKKCQSDAIGAAVIVAQIASGEIEDFKALRRVATGCVDAIAHAESFVRMIALTLRTNPLILGWEK